MNTMCRGNHITGGKLHHGWEITSRVGKYIHVGAEPYKSWCPFSTDHLVVERRSGSFGLTVCLIMMTTVMKRKNHSKKPKLDHEPVRAMAEPPRKIHQDARRKAAALRRAKNVPPKDSSTPSSKNPEAPAANNVDVHPLVPYPVSPPTKE